MKLLFWKTLFDFSKPERVFDAVLRSSFINLLARGFGYLKNLAIAILLGFSYQTDAFFMALSLLGVFMIFVDVFDSIGVPNLVSARLKSQEEFEKLAGLLLTFTTILACSLALLAIVFFPVLLKVPFGFKKEAIYYTKESYLLLLPYLFFSFFFHHFGAILRSLRRFTIYFMGEFIFSFFSFVFMAIGLYFFRDYRVLPISFSLSQFLATLYMVYTAREHIKFKFYMDENVRLLLKHFFYLTGIYGVFHLYILVDRAFGSLLGEKGVSALTYGLLLAHAPKGVIKFEHMAITSLSEVGGALYKLNFYIKKLLLISTAFTFFFVLFSDLLVDLFFGHGAFTKTDVHLTATATRFYALSLPFAFLWPVLYRVFQIQNRLKPIFLVAILGVLANAMFNYLFVVKLGLGIIGICLGTFLAYLVICLVSYIIIWKFKNG
ncbi:lipid II flippase MurJ [Thermodesulfobacterium sp.]|jgi:putative peptidoglycan lipid II flippase|uniref:lipid II flippase MurJ n=1 Tax=Thermodesulfobacterium sp. TaxID=1965289 RepID=UPI00257AF902|nr:lipid II flippase MurJ [Thermodesulfobacterium sp.]MBZ4681589.1 virulence factor family protein [Thermodesulfobacterium sp.]